MTIETKYNIGDEVWFIKDNKPQTMKVSYIEIIAASTVSKPCIRYGFGNFERYTESLLFPTKEELLKSL